MSASDPVSTPGILGSQPSPVPEDPDPTGTQEWVDSLDAMIDHVGPARAAYVLKQLEARARELGVAVATPPYSAYRNTILLARQRAHPGDVAREERITAIIRLNALAMVARANKAYGELGGPVASYASAAEIFEVVFNPVAALYVLAQKQEIDNKTVAEAIVRYGLSTDAPAPWSC